MMVSYFYLQKNENNDRMYNYCAQETQKKTILYIELRTTKKSFYANYLVLQK